MTRTCTVAEASRHLNCEDSYTISLVFSGDLGLAPGAPCGEIRILREAVLAFGRANPQDSPQTTRAGKEGLVVRTENPTS